MFGVEHTERNNGAREPEGGLQYRRGVLFAACFASLVAACAAEESSQEAASSQAHTIVEVPIARDQEYGLVSLSIAGHDGLWFVLDTAASSSVVTPATRDLLGLVTATTQATVTGGSGRAGYQAAELPRFQFGGLEFHKLGVVVIDLSRFQGSASGRTFSGILGNDVLRRFDFMLDLPRSALRLRPRGSGPAENFFKNAACVPNLADDDGWLVINLKVDGAPVRAIIDTGAGRSIYNWSAARAVGLTPGDARLRPAAENAQGLGSAGATPTVLYRFAVVEAGSIRFPSMTSRIADLPVFESIGLARRPAVIFGTNYLTDRAMAVSYPGREICFNKPSDPGQ